MAQDWNSLVTSVLAEVSSDANEQAYLRAKLRTASGTYHLAFAGLMTGFSVEKVKDLLRRELRDLTEL